MGELMRKGDWVAAAEGTKAGRATVSLPAIGIILCITAE